MIEVSHRKFIWIFTILVLTASLSILVHQAHATSPTGVMVALYSYPDSTWDAVAQAKIAHPSVPVVAIINPSNGPGSSQDLNFVSGIQKLHSVGVVVLGYDPTGYTSRNMSKVKDDIDTYKSLYNIDGIFFDEMSNWAGNETYYSNISSYAKSLGYTMTVGNPGTDVPPSYIGTMDNLVIYESSGLPALSALGGWHTTYSKSNFSMISFGINSLNQTFVNSTASYVGYMYITNGNLPNPYGTIPPYFGNLVTYLDTGLPGTVLPPPTIFAPQHPTNLKATTVSYSRINLSWNAPTNDGGSPITGYQIDRSKDNGTTWSTLVVNTSTVATSYPSAGLAPSTSYTYRVSAINLAGTSLPSNTDTTTTPAKLFLTITSVDLSGNPLTGLWTELRSASGALINTGFTSKIFHVSSGKQFTVLVANYQNYTFNHWNDGNTNPSRIITPTANTTLTAYYNTS